MLDASEAEHALLGAVLYDNTALHRIDGLAPSHFHEPVHGRIYAAISDLVGLDRGADPISVGDRMAADAGLIDAGGRDYLGRLFQNAPPAANAPEYAAIIVDNATRRSLCDAAATISRLATDDRERDAGEIAIEAEKALTEIARTGVTRDAWCEAETAVLRAYQRARAGGGMPGVATGLVGVDAVLGGLRPSTVNVLAGRPGTRSRHRPCPAWRHARFPPRGVDRRGRLVEGRSASGASGRAGPAVLRFRLRRHGAVVGPGVRVFDLSEARRMTAQRTTPSKPTAPGLGVAKGPSRRIVVSFDEETFGQIRKRAVASGVSFAAGVRELVEWGLMADEVDA